MSSRRAHVVLSERARRDYENILLYGLLAWGEDVSLDHQGKNKRALGDLEDYPEMGRAEKSSSHLVEASLCSR